MDIICIVLKKTIIRNRFCSCGFGPAQRQHSAIVKTHCKTLCFCIIVLTLGRQMSSGKVRITEEGPAATEDVPKK